MATIVNLPTKQQQPLPTPTTTMSSLMPPPPIPFSSSPSPKQSLSTSYLLELDLPGDLSTLSPLPSHISPTASSEPSSTAHPIASPLIPFTLSPAQLLAVVPQPASFSISAFLSYDVPVNRPAHSSSKKNQEYDSILPSSLVRISDQLLIRFKQFVASMSPDVTFNSELKLPFHASSLTNEVDVIIHLETPAIIAAWETVLAMVPTSERNYELMAMR